MVVVMMMMMMMMMIMEKMGVSHEGMRAMMIVT